MMVPTRSRALGQTDLLRVAVPKGSLFAGCVDILGRAGLDIGPLRDLGRQLTVVGDGVEYIIAKPTDVPVYVAYGAADVAIGGKDVLVEAGLDVAELVDLEFGACRFVVAQPQDRADGVDDRYRHLGVLRVATKYPRVAEAHFERRGIQVEIVKLHGNVELAPLIGMADVIVDIVATGRTLAENGLVVVDEVFSSTARLVANPVALKTDDRIAELAVRCADAVAATERT